MIFFRRSPERKREKLHRSAPEGPLRDHLAVSLPSSSTSLEELPLLAIDLETTGLDPAKDRILSIGFVPVDGLTIPLGGAREIIVKPGEGQEVGASAVLHGLTDDQVAAGVPLKEALEETLLALRGRALLAHHAKIEVDFLSAACQKVFGAAPAFVVVDTLKLGHELLSSGDQDIPRGRLRLNALHSHFGLPRRSMHNALCDAFACAELYLALVAELGKKTLRQVS